MMFGLLAVRQTANTPQFSGKLPQGFADPVFAHSALHGLVSDDLASSGPTNH